jgi:uncharacterized tellurite resistance protein B-like protein
VKLFSWLSVDHRAAEEYAPLRELLAALDQIDEPVARHLARFAYLLGRVALADRHVSDEEVRSMEALIAEEGGLTRDQATVIVGLARSSNRLFGGTADFTVTQEFAAQATYAQKVALVRALFAVARARGAISAAEEAEIHRIANQLRIEPNDLTAIRVRNRKYLPGLASSGDS